MGKKLNELYQEIVNMSDLEKVLIGKKSAVDVLAYLGEKMKAEDAATMYAMLIGTYVGADSKVNLAEYSYCKAIFGFDLSYEGFVAMVAAACEDKFIEMIDKFIDSAAPEVKTSFVMLGIAICSCDDTITVSEMKLLEKYIL